MPAGQTHRFKAGGSPFEAHRPWSCVDPSVLLSPLSVSPVNPGRGGSLLGKPEGHPARLPQKPCGWNTMFIDPGLHRAVQTTEQCQPGPTHTAGWQEGRCDLVSCLRIHSCSYLNFAGVQGRWSDCRNVQDPVDTQGRKKVLERNSEITPILKEGANLGQKGYSWQPAHRSPSGNLQSRAPP